MAGKRIPSRRNNKINDGFKIRQLPLPAVPAPSEIGELTPGIPAKKRRRYASNGLGGSRTLTGRSPGDFESPTSADSVTRPHRWDLATGTLRKQDALRFWARVDKPSRAACWNWTGSVDTPGYGAFKIDGKKYNTHRIAYEMAHGRVLPTIQIIHTCDNRLCCNPHHLRAGTRLANVRDMDDKGRRRSADGEKHPSAKLTDALVARLRIEYIDGPDTAGDMARRLGVDRKTIQGALDGKKWKHVPFPAGYWERYKDVAAYKKTAHRSG